MQEKTPLHINNHNNKRPSALLSAKEWVGLLLVLVIIGIVSGIYFLAQKQPPQKTSIPQTKSLPTINKNEEGNEIGKGDAESKEVKSTGSFEYYKIQDNAIYYSHREVVGADTATFQEVGDKWAKDKNYVYYEGCRQQYLDPATAKVLSRVYVADNAGVWYGPGCYKKADKTDADPSTFSVVGHGYGEDMDNIYYLGQKIIGADVASFTILNALGYEPSGDTITDQQTNWWYTKDKNNAYYHTSAILNADVESFVYLGGEYAKDKNNVYYQGKIIHNADANSFALVGSYAKDANHVFHGNKILNIDIDPESFAVVSREVIKDNRHVYFKDYYADNYSLISNVDAPTFQYIGICKCVEMSCGNYYKDKYMVFVGSEPSGVIDVSSFQYFGVYWTPEGEMPYSVSYAKDRNAVYHSCGVILENADLTTFRDLGGGYAKDKNAVWYLDDVMDGVDAATFQSLGESYAKDKNHAYFAGAVITGADAPTFEIVKESVPKNKYNYDVYAKDKNNVYSFGRIVKGAGPENCTPQQIDNCNPDF